MKQFAALLEAIVNSPSRNRKVALLAEYFRQTADPDRGYALAAMTGSLKFASVKPSLFKMLVSERTDPVLFALSYDFVGDLAETVSLIWPSRNEADDLPLGDVVKLLDTASRSDTPKIVSGLLDQLDASSRYALIKMATGGLRIGASTGIVRLALSKCFGKSEDDIEDVWLVGDPPYQKFFQWLAGGGAKPGSDGAPRWRSFMLANPLSDSDKVKIDLQDYTVEWKWDGIRVQAISDGKRTWLYSRTGEDITAAFPDLRLPEGFSGALDGELLARRSAYGDLLPGTFNDLQQRLNRKSPSSSLVSSWPVFLRAYDLLSRDGVDLRHLATTERRAILLQSTASMTSSSIDVSELIDVQAIDDLDRLRRTPPDPAIEGIMLKKKSAPYVAGRTAGLWYKWKKAPMTADVVLMYAQRGHGKRSGLYSDFTFGAWSDDGATLLPVGKAYFGFSDAELATIDKYVRENTVDRFGPVRSIRAGREQGLVFEIEFEGIGFSTRHKSGIALRFPRVSRLRFDKPATDADTVASLKNLIADPAD